MNLDKILDEAMRLDASDVHLICNNKPMLRIARELIPVEGSEVLTEEDMSEMYDYLVRGNVDKDEVFNTTRKLDTSYEYKGIRLRVNISLSDDGFFTRTINTGEDFGNWKRHYWEVEKYQYCPNFNIYPEDCPFF